MSAAWIATSAVSRSRISPTISTSGSWRRNERNACANVSPICGFTGTWFTPGSMYSTGSSTVRILRSVMLSSVSAAYSVVVLPLPVGPVTSTMPNGRAIASRSVAISPASKPSESKSSCTSWRSRMRSTALSPCIVGDVATRKSMSLPCTETRMRPSCGRRRSAMLRPAMTLMRDTMGADTALGCVSISRSTPSERKRTTRPRSAGSR